MCHPRFLSPLLRQAVFFGITLLSVGGTSAAVLEQISPNPTVYIEITDYGVMDFSGIGNVTAPLQAVDISLGLGNTSTSGCESADFAGFTTGNIALLQRGACEFDVKAENAEAAGASGVLIFNQGNTDDPSRNIALFGTLGDDYTGTRAVLQLSYDLGAELAGLASTSGVVIHMQVTEADVAQASEPGSLVLLALGLVGLAFSRRKRAA